MLSRLRHPYLLLVLTTLFWSGNMVLGRAIRDQVPPLSLAFWRWAIALALVLPLALPHLRAQWPLLRAGWQAVVVLGLLGVGGYNTLAYVGLQYTPATNAVLLNSFIPIATITLSWLFLSKHLRALEWLGVLLSFAGVTAIVCRGDIATLAMLTPNIGDLWMLAAVFTWALYTIGLQWRPVGLNPMLLLAAFTLVGLAALAPAYAWEIAQGKRIVVSAGSLAGIAYTGIFPGFLGYVFYNRAVAEVGASKASLFIHLMPVFGTILSALFLDEIPQMYHYVGMTLIFAGIYLTTAALPQAKAP
ncbi:MAG: DMT family transporter [Candidatus Accumulibacter sp.]|jgi:drug/metabolite transporter (DMT)-like permease|uniref:DMT family transporter n=1 Tax=Accumulibacter sp. TaxID=2053492 RepID=UPI001AD404A0|nr:DMT family transporter [Accumulibacter sp.]MBK8115488.1 DMT family transporter [Accumulibacter sp.]MBN8439285.1 DMT family transporter [Accumulibacter sp.]